MTHSQRLARVRLTDSETTAADISGCGQDYKSGYGGCGGDPWPGTDGHFHSQLGQICRDPLRIAGDSSPLPTSWGEGQGEGCTPVH